MEKNYNKYQWSIFTGAGRAEQYVVRADTFKDLQTGIAEVKGAISTPEVKEDPIMDATRNVRETKDFSDFDVDETAKCPLHGVMMTHYEREGNDWFAHRLSSGAYCNGRNTKYNKNK